MPGLWTTLFKGTAGSTLRGLSSLLRGEEVLKPRCIVHSLLCADVSGGGSGVLGTNNKQ